MTIGKKSQKAVSAVNWMRPPMLDVGSPTAEAIFVEVGAALSKWAEIEELLSLQFGYIVGSFNGAAGAAFGHVASVDTRIQMLSDAAEYSLSQTAAPLLSKLKPVLTDTRKAAELRNDIAHGRVIGVINTPATTTYFLAPPSSHTRSVWGRTERRKRFEDMQRSQFQPGRFLSASVKYGYTAEQIEEITNNFSHLSKSHRSIIHSLLEWSLPANFPATSNVKPPT